MLFSFFLLNLELYENAKWSCTCFLFYFLPTLPFNLFLSSGRFGSVSVETSKCLLERREKKELWNNSELKTHFPKAGEAFESVSWHVAADMMDCHQRGQFFLGQSHDPPSNVIITCLWTFEGIQVLWEFSSISISIELLLSIWTLGGAACSAGQSSQLCGIKDGGMEGGAENERGNWARCDVAQRNMAGYDVWRLGGKIRGQNSIKPYE